MAKSIYYLAMESMVAIFNVVYIHAVQPVMIEMLGFDKGENLFILIFISESSDTKLPSSPAKRRCSTRSGRSATSFAFR